MINKILMIRDHEVSLITWLLALYLTLLVCLLSSILEYDACLLLNGQFLIGIKLVVGDF